MYKKSSEYVSFSVAGYSHHEGWKVAEAIKPGTKLDIVPEFDNPYDPNALALYIGGSEGIQIGYVPRRFNHDLALMFFYGHGDDFECHITQVNPTEDLEDMVHAIITVTDARK